MKFPNRIYGFVDFQDLQNNTRLSYTQIPTEAKICTVIKHADYVEDEAEVAMLDIFMPIQTQVGEIRDNKVTKLKFYLDIEAIEHLIVVIPDIGGAPNNHFIIKNCKEWTAEFIDILGSKCNLDDLDLDD